MKLRVNLHSLVKGVAALLATAASAGCANSLSPGSTSSIPPTSQQTLPGGTTAATPAQPASRIVKPALRASEIAARLALAEAAYEAGDHAQLADLVAALNATGLTPHKPAGVDALATWQTAAGAPVAPFRGRLLGPAYVRGELAPGQIWSSAQTFKSGEATTLSVSHRGSGPVRMTVSDAKARSVCVPASAQEPACRFTPMFTQRYDIELKNEGDTRAVYFLVFD